jgi:pimeloyl-ACP methyl ester carboxylesterase
LQRTTRIRAKGFELHADTWDGGDSAHVLLLHGLGGNSITWHAVAPVLADKLRARVLAVDLPGFGASHPTGRRVGFDALSEVVLDVLRREAPSGATWHVAGNSLGGLLALRAAVEAPRNVSRVTLASVSLPLVWGRTRAELTALGGYVPSAVPWLGRALIARYVRTTGLPGVVDDPVRFLFRDPKRLDVELRERLLAVSDYRLTWVAEAARALEQTTRSLGVALLRPDCAARWIRDVRCPVRSIHGSHDPIYPAAAWHRLANERTDWDHVRLDDVGHVPQLEAPLEFAAHMMRESKSGQGYGKS